MPAEIPGRPVSVPPPTPAGSASTNPLPGSATTGAPKPYTINIAEEFGTAKRNLPPLIVVMLAIGAVLIVVGIVVYLERPKPQAAGSLDSFTAAEIPSQSSTMVAMTFTIRNTNDKVLYVRNVQGKLKTASGESTAEAVPGVDFSRYFQAFPGLGNGAQPPLSPDDKLQPGEALTRTVVVVFPVTLDAFTHRQLLSVVVQPQDQPVPVVLSK
jgi:hypothetical protein